MLVKSRLVEVRGTIVSRICIAHCFVKSYFAENCRFLQS
jgi:hypothetical protein